MSDEFHCTLSHSLFIDIVEFFFWHFGLCSFYHLHFIHEISFLSQSVIIARGVEEGRRREFFFSHIQPTKKYHVCVILGLRKKGFNGGCFSFKLCF